MTTLPPPPPPHDATRLDVSVLTTSHQLSFVPAETEKALDARLDAERLDADLRRTKDLATFRVGLAVLLITLVASLAATFLATGELQKWGMVLATSTVTGFVSFTFGKNAGKAEK